MFTQGGTTTKSRVIPGPSFFNEERRKLSTALPWVSKQTRFSLSGTQVTESKGNRWPPPKGDLQDYGSEFFTRKTELVNTTLPYSVLNLKKTTGPQIAVKTGSLIANVLVVHDDPSVWSVPTYPLKVNFPSDLSSSREQLVEKGTRAIAACAPSNQITQVASFLGELFQDVPAIPGVHLWESRLRVAEGLTKGLANEFLNLGFGVLPTISDMKDFLKASHEWDKALDQFIRDAGRVVRREFHFPIEKSVSEDVLPNVISPAGMMRFKSGQQYSIDDFADTWPGALPGYETIRKRTIEREIWFNGAFTYHLPDGYDYHSKSDRRRLIAKLLGAEPDLNTIWQLAPWSWAVDWISNASSVVKNVQNYITYGSIMRYGYVMETTTVTDVYSAGKIVAPVASFYVGEFLSPYLPRVHSITLRTTTKKRVQANPFGFGFSWEGLSSFQQAILAALGITRVVR